MRHCAQITKCHGGWLFMHNNLKMHTFGRWSPNTLILQTVPCVTYYATFLHRLTSDWTLRAHQCNAKPLILYKHDFVGLNWKVLLLRPKIYKKFSNFFYSVQGISIISAHNFDKGSIAALQWLKVQHHQVEPTTRNDRTGHQSNKH